MKTLTLLLAIPLLAAEPSVRVRVGERIVELPRERYVAAVLAGESSVFRSAEALKAMAVAARTYAVRLRGRHSAEGFDFCSTTHCQRVEVDAMTPRLQAAAAATAGELLWYEGKPAFTPYSRNCGGRTEDASVVWPDLAAPYLKSHPDPYCARGPASKWEWKSTPKQIGEALRRAQLNVPKFLERILIAGRTPSGSGRVWSLQLAGGGEMYPIAAGSFRLAIGREIAWNAVRSDRYDVYSSDGRIVFVGSGAGHGVGLCQDGAEQMGLQGRPYGDILAFYYPGTVLSTTARGIPWQRLAGDSVAVLTTDAQSGRAVLAQADRELRAIRQRTGWPLAMGLEILVYPDLDAFRDGTGEPGWVAAHTIGRHIHLQPAAVLRGRNALDDTLRHELLHVMVESQAAPGLPLWFREGLVEFLAGGVRDAGPARIPPEADLRQTADPARARRAYADAARAVADLVRQNGESTVLAWVRSGMPASRR